MEQVSADLPLPVLLYNIPQCTRDLGMAKLLRLIAAVPNIIGIKDSSGYKPNLATIARARAQTPFAFIIGSDDLLREAFEHGAVGSISGIASACPELILPFCEALRTGNKEQACALQSRLDEFIFHIRGASVALGHETRVADAWAGNGISGLAYGTRPPPESSQFPGLVRRPNCHLRGCHPNPVGPRPKNSTQVVSPSSAKEQTMNTLGRVLCTVITWVFVFTCLGPRLAAQVNAPGSMLDLSQARIVADPALTVHEKNAVTMLVEEVEKRTALRWSAQGSGAAITIHHGSGAGPAEGFRLQSTATGVDIRGNDERGTLFGIGRFLRELRWQRQQAAMGAGLDIVSAPKYKLRGHQIGYRPKVNTYDAWTPRDFEQYLRDMIIFGTNAVELIPPRSDDDDDSPHFHLSKIDMMVEMSRICDKYGIDVWIWYPAMDKDYSDPAQVDFALKEWSNIYQRLPRIDAVFVPGGDPGRTEPKYLMALLEKQKVELRKFHPKAQMWVSPQNFSSGWFDEFIDIVKAEPAWLDGVVYGPWTRVTIEELRAKLPSRYPIRYYPDITHSVHCEYPVPDWDVAYAVTEARETINPRPLDYSRIFRHIMPSTIGFITYSEGVNDDVNKFVWSGLGWDPNQDVGTILREWARWFISPKYETGIAQALLDLEQDWRGPLLPHASVDATLHNVQALEHAATPQMLLNWRFQQVLYRAYYDGFVRQRLLYETGLEEQARERLREAPRTGSLVAVEEATRILDQAVTKPAAEDLRSRVFALGEALYQSIHMQLSVDRYKAIAVSRGANLDTIDFPLNNRVGWRRASRRSASWTRRRRGSRRSMVFSTAAIPVRAASMTIWEVRRCNLIWWTRGRASPTIPGTSTRFAPSTQRFPGA